MIRVLLFLLSFSAMADIKLDTNYSYQYDNQGYVNHQVTENGTYKDYGIKYQHNETVSQSQFFYDSILITKQVIPEIKLGVGAIYGSGFSIPNYLINIRKYDIELNVERNSAASSLIQSRYSTHYRDDISLSYDHTFDKYTFVISGLLSEYDNNNQSKGFLIKNIYQINDNLSLQNHNRYIFTDTTNSSYFSPINYDYNRFLVSYVYPITEDLVFKFIAGPSIVNINNRRELNPYYEVKSIYNSKIGKFNMGYKCNETVNNYNWCEINAGITVNF